MMGQVPFSNPAGNNQTSPGALPKGSNVNSPSFGQIPGSPVQGSNPYAPTPTVPTSPVAIAQPSTGGMVPVTSSPNGATPNTSASNGFITNNSSYSNGQNDLQKQLVDIYGKGVGGSLFSLLNSMSGTDSTVLQEYIKSLQPQMAQAQANTNAALGAGGVSANSSVAAIADSNLNAQEQASIAGESAKLTQSEEMITAQILQGMQGAASKEVATSAWSTFADVMNNITGDVGNVVSGSDFKTSAGSGAGGASPTFTDSSSGDEGGW